MVIIQLCLAVIPLLYITTANGDIFIGHAVEDFSVDSKATIMILKAILHAVNPLTLKNCVTQIDKALPVEAQKQQW